MVLKELLLLLSSQEAIGALDAKCLRRGRPVARRLAPRLAPPAAAALSAGRSPGRLAVAAVAAPRQKQKQLWVSPFLRLPFKTALFIQRNDL